MRWRIQLEGEHSEGHEGRGRLEAVAGEMAKRLEAGGFRLASGLVAEIDAPGPFVPSVSPRLVPDQPESETVADVAPAEVVAVPDPGSLTVDEIRGMVAGLTDAERERMAALESRGKRRSSVLRVLARRRG
jgi:hypothetical protein